LAGWRRRATRRCLSERGVAQDDVMSLRGGVGNGGARGLARGEIRAGCRREAKDRRADVVQAGQRISEALPELRNRRQTLRARNANRLREREQARAVILVRVLPTPAPVAA
jgi:hypothetical protein